MPAEVMEGAPGDPPASHDRPMQEEAQSAPMTTVIGIIYPPPEVRSECTIVTTSFPE